MTGVATPGTWSFPGENGVGDGVGRRGNELEAGGAREGDSEDIIGVGVDSLVATSIQVILDFRPSPGANAKAPDTIHERSGRVLSRRVCGDPWEGVKRRRFVSRRNAILPIIAELLGVGAEQGEFVVYWQPAFQGVDPVPKTIQRHGAIT